MTISVFFPAYNDAPSLPDLIRETFRVLSQCAAEFEVIVVNDGSADGTEEVLARLQAEYGPRLRAIMHGVNRGYGAALRTGIQAARHDYVFYTDGDAQYDVGELPRLIEALPPGGAWVNGYKRSRADARRRVWIGQTYRHAVRLLFGIHLQDVDCDFRLMRRDAVQALPLISDSGAICVELVWRLERAGYRAVEIPVTHRPRLHGESQFFKPAPLWRTARQLWSLYWLLR